MAPVVHKVRDLYKVLYLIGSKIPKRDKLGLHAIIERECLGVLSFCIEASLLPKLSKKPVLEKTRIKIESLKQLIRVSYELKMIDEKKYLALETGLQEISKMANGWLKYTETQNPAKL